MLKIVTLCYLGLLLLIFVPIIICSAFINYYPNSGITKFIKKHIITNRDLDPPAQL